VSWGLPAAVLAGGAGALLGLEPRLAVFLGVAGAGAVVVAIWPFPALLAIVAVRAAFADTVIIDAVTVAGGGLALVLVAPRLPMRLVTVPLLVLLLFALPSVPLEPSPDEGVRPEALYLPIVGLEYAAAPSYEFHEWLRLAVVLVVGVLAASVVKSRERLHALTAVILASSLIPAVIALVELAQGEAFPRAGTALESIRGPFSHPNYLAFYLVVVLAAGIVFVLEVRSRLARLAGSMLIALAGVCLLLTYTRAAWIGFATLLVLLAALRERRIAAVTALIVLLAGLAFPGATSDVGERFGDLSSASASSDSNSWSWRTGQWERMVPYGAEQPLTGQGFGSYSRLTLEEFGTRDLEYPTVLDPTHPIGSPRGFTAHNDYVKMWVELGLPGLLLWLAVLIGMVIAMFMARRVSAVRGYAEGGLALALALIIMSASDHIEAYAVVLIYAVAWLGGVAGTARAAATSASS